MSTRSSTRNLFPPLENPKLTIRRRTHVDPNLLNDFNIATNGNGDNEPPPEGGDLPVLDLRMMEELCQPTLNGRGGPIESIDTFAQRGKSSSSITSASDSEIVALKPEMAKINKNLMKVLQINQQVKAVTHSYETWGGPHSYNDCPATIGQTQNIYAVGAYNQGVVTTTEFTNYMKQNDAILKNMQTNMTSLTNSNLELKNMFGQFMKMNTASSSGSGTLPSNTITNPQEDLKGITTRSGIAYKGPTIPTTSSPPKVVERETEVTKDTMPPTNNESAKDVQPLIIQVETQSPNSEPVVAPFVEPVEAPANDQMEKFFQIFQDLNFNIIFADALILIPKFASTIKSLLTNKEKLFELARTPLNEHCSTVLLKKLPEMLGNPSKFLIPCEFSGMDEYLALADLDASINLMPLSIGCALIDVYDGELSLRVGNKAVTFNLDQTSRYSTNYDAELINQIDVIDVACEEYSQEVLRIFVSGNPTPSTKPIVSTSSPTLTPFRDGDFLLEETDPFLAIEDESISPEIYDSYYDSKGYILLLEEFLNDAPSSPPLPSQELKVVEPKNEKSSIDEPPVVKLKDLPPHFEYAFLEGDDKLTVIIAKYLKDEEKTALIMVLKSHKQSIAWKLFDIKGINLEFCTYKILIEDDFKPVVQHQRRVNPKIHEEKSHFMVKEGIVLGHKISKNEIVVDKAKVDVIAKLPYPTTVKGIRRFLGHASFYRRFIQEFSKIARPMTRLLEKDTPFNFSKECIEAFLSLKKKLIEAPILVAPDWDLPFELMCDASDFAICAVLGQRKTKHFQPIYYASKTMTDTQAYYTTTSKELLAVVQSAPTNDARVVCKFLKSLFSRFGTPCAIISDGAMNFCNDQFTKVMLKYGVTHCLATAYHPQTSGQVEVSNRGLKRILERIIGENRASWSDKLDDAIWAFQKTKRIHDSKIKDRIFNVGDRVLLFNSRLKIFSGKLKTRWTGPFTVTQVFPYGTVELSQTDGPNFKVNGHRLKHYFGGDIPPMVVPDL
nr:hypothetical protein [Tanacetum cinerariifolium]